MKTCFIPQFTSINPYQLRLAESLEKLGVISEGIEERKAYLPKEVNARDAKVLHIHWLHGFYNAASAFDSVRPLLKLILGLLVLKLKQVSIVWTAHNIRQHELKNSFADRVATLSVSKLSDAIIVHSKAARQELIKDLPFQVSHKVYVIPHANYIDDYKNDVKPKDARQQLEIPPSKFVFLFFGLVRPYKGVPELIEAFESLNDKDAYLLIVGQSKNESLTKYIQQKEKVNSTIQFVPSFVADDDIQLYMNAADVVVFPYRNILTSGAVMLAMSFGRACLAPKKDCITEVLNDEGAFLYNPEVDQDLSVAMENAIRSRTLIDEMGQHNYAAAKLWGWDDVANQTLEVYQQCLSR